MSDIVVRVDNLGKRYQIGRRQRYRTLRDTVAEAAAAPLRWLRRTAPRCSDAADHIWALREVTFEVRRGDVVGVIGRNGAGKSTLLKVLSRITEPTVGAADIRGRVGSLLEIGAGFHPELTGRENVFLNGAVLGMKRAEIVHKFDEIVAFAEVERFIDTPVKHYSSGMYMRLAFAVAAHLEPDILIVDEVLAVGDAVFQKKCLGKMGEVARADRTVLFVSHNMQTIASLCTRAVCLRDGQLDFVGSAHEGVGHYYRQLEARSDDDSAARRPGGGQFRFVEARPEQPQYRPDEPKRIRFAVRGANAAVPSCTLMAHIVDEHERVVSMCDSRFLGVAVRPDGGRAEGTLVIRQPWFKPGDYTVDLFLIEDRVGLLDMFEKACRFQVLPILPYPHSAPEKSIAGAVVLADYDWEVDGVPDVRIDRAQSHVVQFGRAR
jgi:lipopolysaccharide transport system ATP-binding protein